MDTMYINYRVMHDVASAMEESAQRINVAAGQLARQVNAGPFGGQIANLTVSLSAEALDLALQLWLGATLVRLALAKYLHGEYKSVKDLNDLRQWLEGK